MSEQLKDFIKIIVIIAFNNKFELISRKADFRAEHRHEVASGPV